MAGSVIQPTGLVEFLDDLYLERLSSSHGMLRGIYSLPQVLTYSHLQEFSFTIFLSLLKKNLETNDTSFESPYRNCLEPGKKLGVASS